MIIMKDKAKEEIINLLKTVNLFATGEVKTNKHISKMRNRKCSKCKEDIKYEDMCYTQTYKLKNTSKQFQSSFHINCI